MSIVSGHDSASNFLTRKRDKEKAVFHRQLFVNYERWLIVRGFVAKHCLPQCEDLRAVSGIGKGSDCDSVHAR